MLGTVGYGLQILVYGATAISSAAFIATSLYLRGLNVLGLLTPIPGLLISFAWIYAGKDRKVALFTATGIVGLIVFVASVVSTLVYWMIIPQILTQPSPSAPFSLQFFSAFLELAAFSSVVSLLGITYFVLETISFFSAGREFQESMFRIAGWSRIAAVIGAAVLYIIFIFLTLLSVFSSTPGSTTTLVSLQISPGPGNQFVNLFGLALGGILVILAIPEAFAFLGFRRLLSLAPFGPPQPPGSARVIMQTITPESCPNCGNPISMGARYCTSCGRQLA